MQDEPNKPDTPDETPETELPTLVNANRLMLDARVLNGDPVEPRLLKEVLTAPHPPDGELRLGYAEQLLQHALATRETDAAELVARWMDRDPALDAALYDLLNAALDSEPDAVYAFIRARMSAAESERWLPRLQAAARASLRIAIAEGDRETIGNWLRLVGREPASYALVESVLREALYNAGEAARSSGELGLIVLAVAARRDPDSLAHLLEDGALLAALPGNLGAVLRDFDGDAVQVLRTYGAELFVVALVRAALARTGALFTPAVIEQAWGLYTGTQTLALPERYTLPALFDALTQPDPGWLDAGALQTLLALMLRDRRDDLFLRLTRRLSAYPNPVQVLVGAFQGSGLPDSAILSLTEQLINSADLDAQQAADLYVELLGLRSWEDEEFPLIQQLSRLLYQHSAIQVTASVLWHLVDAANEHKDEQIGRVGLRRLYNHLEMLEDDTMLTEALLRLYTATGWSTTLRGLLLTWWRGFARESSLARLQRLDRALEGKKAPEIRVITQTVIAIQKMQGKRTLAEFADAIATTYSVLQAFAESFDPTPKRPSISFDQETVRDELSERIEELSPHERKILANNLKELAELIGEMGDNRSKASLMRRGDDVDRQLMTGVLQPHSAVDTLKWLAGFLGGSQVSDEED